MKQTSTADTIKGLNQAIEKLYPLVEQAKEEQLYISALSETATKVQDLVKISSTEIGELGKPFQDLDITISRMAARMTALETNVSKITHYMVENSGPSQPDPRSCVWRGRTMTFPKNTNNPIKMVPIPPPFSSTPRFPLHPSFSLDPTARFHMALPATLLPAQIDRVEPRMTIRFDDRLIKDAMVACSVRKTVVIQVLLSLFEQGRACNNLETLIKELRSQVMQ
ncbi:hypothetical protein HN928_01035 [bacterium]|jgi:hypothetical protein|nr:hypothetical protein [bacterium]